MVIYDEIAEQPLIFMKSIIPTQEGLVWFMCEGFGMLLSA